jgi:VanZ family protein
MLTFMIQSGVALRLPPHSKHRLSRYGPLILWAVFIFIGSTDLLSAANTGGVLVRPVLWLFPHASERTVAIYQFATRKTGHLTEYFIFAVLCARVFRTSSHELLRRHWFWASIFLVIVYSLSDELHQSFYPSRTASIYDCMIDSLGGLLALTILSWRRGKARRSPDREKYLKSGAVA